MNKDWEQIPFLKITLFFIFLLILKFSSLSHPFYGDELIYLIADFQKTTFWNFVPFSSQYTSHSGHPPLLVLLSFWIYKAGIPFAESIRLLYLSFSALLLTGIWNISGLFTSKTIYKSIPIILIVVNPLFFTQSSMTIGNNLECALILFSLDAFFQKKRRKLLLLLCLGVMIRESLIGLVLLLYLFEENKFKAIKFYLVPCLLLTLFFFAERKALGAFFNHAIAQQRMDHGVYTWSLSNISYLFESLRALAPLPIWGAALLSLYPLLKIESDHKRKFLIIFSTSLPYLAFFGLYSDSQGRDFLILLPLIFIWFTYLLEFKLNIKEIAVPVVVTLLSFQILQFNIVRDKNTPNLHVYFNSYQKMLSYISENPEIRNNLEAHFPFNKIFTTHEFGHLGKQQSISEGKKSYLLTSVPMKLTLIHEVKIPSEDKASLFIYENKP